MACVLDTDNKVGSHCGFSVVGIALATRGVTRCLMLGRCCSNSCLQEDIIEATCGGSSEWSGGHRHFVE